MIIPKKKKEDKCSLLIQKFLVPYIKPCLAEQTNERKKKSKTGQKKKKQKVQKDTKGNK